MVLTAEVGPLSRLKQVEQDSIDRDNTEIQAREVAITAEANARTNAINALVAGAPSNRNTLKELSDAIDAIDTGGDTPPVDLSAIPPLQGAVHHPRLSVPDFHFQIPGNLPNGAPEDVPSLDAGGIVDLDGWGPVFAYTEPANTSQSVNLIATRFAAGDIDGKTFEVRAKVQLVDDNGAGPIYGRVGIWGMDAAFANGASAITKPAQTVTTVGDIIELTAQFNSDGSAGAYQWAAGAQTLRGYVTTNRGSNAGVIAGVQSHVLELDIVDVTAAGGAADVEQVPLDQAFVRVDPNLFFQSTTPNGAPGDTATLDPAGMTTLAGFGAAFEYTEPANTSQSINLTSMRETIELKANDDRVFEVFALVENTGLTTDALYARVGVWGMDRAFANGAVPIVKTALISTAAGVLTEVVGRYSADGIAGTGQWAAGAKTLRAYCAYNRASPGGGVVAGAQGLFVGMGARDVTALVRGVASSGNGILASEYGSMDAVTGEILVANNIDVQHHPASQTKLLTALLLLENVADLSQTVTVISADLIGGTTAQLQGGDVVSYLQLLNGMMIPSGNDAATTIGRTVGAILKTNDGISTGDPLAYFVTKMNTRAAAMGCNLSHFEAPSGLVTTLTHLSTPKDVMSFARALLPYPILLTAWGTQTYHMAITAGTNPRSYDLANTDANLGQTGVLGGKTGHVTGGAVVDTLYHVLNYWQDARGNKAISEIMASPTDAGRYTDNTALRSITPVGPGDAGYGLGMIARGVASAGQTVIALSAQIPAAKVGTLLFLYGQAAQVPGVDFTTDGAGNLNTFAMEASVSYVVFSL